MSTITAKAKRPRRPHRVEDARNRAFAVLLATMLAAAIGTLV